MSKRLKDDEMATHNLKSDSSIRKRVSDDDMAMHSLKSDSSVKKRISEDDTDIHSIDKDTIRQSKRKGDDENTNASNVQFLSSLPKSTQKKAAKFLARQSKKENQGNLDNLDTNLSEITSEKAVDFDKENSNTDDSGVSKKEGKMPVNKSKAKADEIEFGDEKNNSFDASSAAKILLEMYEIVNIHDRPHIYIEERGYWKVITNDKSFKDLKRIIPDEYKKYISTRAKQSDVYDWLIAEAPSYDYEDLTDRENYINLSDCAISIINGKIIKNRKHLFFQFYIDVTYDQCFNCTDDGILWKSFVNSTFNCDKETINALEELIGLAISNIRNLKYSFFLYGRTNTGKSVILNLLQRLINKQYVSHVAFSQLNDEFSIAMLEGKFLNTSGEISGIGKMRLERFKSLTGNDPILVSYKGQPNFELYNQALLVFACNNMPEIAPEEIESFSSRIIVFPFKNSVSRENWIENLTENLLSEPGIIIGAAIRGIIRLQSRNFVFKQSNAMKICKREFIGEYNSFSLFCEDHVRISESKHHITSKIIRDAYKSFCKINGFEVVADPVWAKILKINFSAQSKTKNNSRGYIGIELVNLDKLSLNEDYTDEYNYQYDEGVI